MPQYTVSPSTVLLANAVLLILAIVVALIMSGASVRYRRHIGDTSRQSAQKSVIMHSILLLIAIGLIASALNLIFS